MNKFLLIILSLLLILVAIVSDIKKRSASGLPNPVATDIQTVSIRSNLKIGISSVDITKHIFYKETNSREQIKEEKAINPWFKKKSDKNNKRHKIINKFFIKSIIFKGNKNSSFLILSLDLPLLSDRQKTTITEALNREFGFKEEFVLIYTSGIISSYTITSTILDSLIPLCINRGLDNLQKSEFSVIQENSSLSANFSSVNIKDFGNISLPPLCGPQKNNSVYDATEYVNRQLKIITSDSGFLPQLSVSTKVAKDIPISLIIFRSNERETKGGIVISPFTPAFTPSFKVGGDLSSDYIYHLCTLLEKKLGGTFLFVRSPGANIIPFIDNFSHPNSHRFGTKLAAKLISNIKNTKWQKLKKAYSYNMPIKLTTKEEINFSKEKLESIFNKYYKQSYEIREIKLDLSVKRNIQNKYFTALYMRDFLNSNIQKQSTFIKGVRLNDFILLSLPAKTSFEIEKKIRRNFRDIKMCLTDNMGSNPLYIPEKNFYKGSYEGNKTIYTSNAEDELIKASLKLIKAVKPFIEE